MAIVGCGEAVHDHTLDTSRISEGSWELDGGVEYLEPAISQSLLDPTGVPMPVARLAPEPDNIGHHATALAWSLGESKPNRSPGLGNP